MSATSVFYILIFWSDFSLPWMLRALASCNSHLPEAAASISGGTTLMHAQPLDFSSLHLLLMENRELTSTQRIRTPCWQLHFQGFCSLALHTQHFYSFVVPLLSCLRILSAYALGLNMNWNTVSQNHIRRDCDKKKITFDREAARKGRVVTKS